MNLTRSASNPALPLAGMVCAVTGGAQGIGWALSEAFARAGAHVYACDISPTYLDAAQSSAKALPDTCRIELERCDVSDASDLARWIGSVFEQEGRIDILINNAAFIRWEPMERLTIEEAEQTVSTGLLATIRATALVLPHMRKAGRGHVVNIGSSAGRVITASPSAPYAAAKAAVEAFTETVRLELAGSPVRVTLVRPGVVSGTSFFREHVRFDQLPRATDFMPAVTPPQVASAVLDAVRKGKPFVDVPGSLRVLYLLYALAPNATRRLLGLGGAARRDVGAVVWGGQKDS